MARHPPIDYERGQAMWLSYPDCAHLFERCLLAEYDYEIVYGSPASLRAGPRQTRLAESHNDRKYYSIDRAREVLGYDPQDNSAEWDGDEHVDGDRR